MISSPDIERLKGLLEKAIANWDALSPLSTRPSFVLAGSELAENIRVALPALLSDRADLEAEVERLTIERDGALQALLSVEAENSELKTGVSLERNRACVLLEAAYEAADWLGPGDSIADTHLVPAILEADGDPEYARTWAEERGFFAPVLTRDRNEPSPVPVAVNLIGREWMAGDGDDDSTL